MTVDDNLMISPNPTLATLYSLRTGARIVAHKLGHKKCWKPDNSFSLRRPIEGDGERKKRKDGAARSGDDRDMTRPAAAPPPSLRLDRLASPLGETFVVTDESGSVRAIDFHDYEPRLLRLLRRHYGDAPLPLGAAPSSVRQALTAYFEGDLSALTHIPWTTAGTVFQRQVWSALTEIPPGQTLTYGQLAQRIGHPSAIRAVGLANGSNPVSIVVPCHRLIGADGSLTGYGGGLHRKAWLLEHEGAR